MRILHLEAGRHFYGGPRQVAYLIDELAERGFENLLVCNEGHALAKRMSARALEWRLRGDFDVTLYRRLIHLLDTERPDLVHVHSRRGVDTFGGRAARAAGVPAVLTRRVQSAEIGAWLRFKCRPYAAIATISSAVHDELVRSGVSDNRLEPIPSAVDTALFRPDPDARARLTAAFGLPHDALIAGAAAQLVRRKGLDRLIPLAARLIAAEPRFRLVLFGQGAGRNRLERAARRHGIEEQLVFAGYRDDWPALAPGFDVFLHPARREGLGAVVLEAMSAGVPVIASAVGGVIDAIDDGVDGRLVDPADSATWHDATARLLADRDERERLGAAARRKVEARFTIDRMTDSYIALYGEVAGFAPD